MLSEFYRSYQQFIDRRWLSEFYRSYRGEVVIGVLLEILIGPEAELKAELVSKLLELLDGTTLSHLSVQY